MPPLGVWKEENVARGCEAEEVDGPFADLDL